MLTKIRKTNYFDWWNPKPAIYIAVAVLAVLLLYFGLYLHKTYSNHQKIDDELYNRLSYGQLIKIEPVRRIIHTETGSNNQLMFYDVSYKFSVDGITYSNTNRFSINVFDQYPISDFVKNTRTIEILYAETDPKTNVVNLESLNYVKK